MLYIRMFLVMAVTLYTSRIVLKILGVEDFGIYNVVGGIVVLFSFINNAMTTTVMRFLNYELGQNNIDNARTIFSASILIHVVIVIFILVIGETAGIWFLNKYINIPESRMTAALWTYQFSLLTTIAKMLRAPYNAAIIAAENMSFYAYISILESALNLVAIFCLSIIHIDLLIAYSILLFIVALLINASYYAYCLKRLSFICKLKFIRCKQYYSQLISFSGWSLFGCLADVGALQGLNILFNIFRGVLVNAAMGIGIQVMTAVYAFSNSFQTAFKPQIVKLYANGDSENMLKLVFQTSRFSYFLLLLLAVPLSISMDGILSIWLGNVPQHAAVFCRLLIYYTLIDAISAPLWIVAQAIGNIRNYQIIISISILLILPISYILLFFGFSPAFILGIKVIQNIACLIVRIAYLKRRIEFPIWKYMRNVINPIVVSTAAVALFSLLIKRISNCDTLISDIIKMIAGFGCTGLIIYLIGLTSAEKKLIHQYWNQFINKIHLCKQ